LVRTPSTAATSLMRAAWLPKGSSARLKVIAKVSHTVTLRLTLAVMCVLLEACMIGLPLDTILRNFRGVES
jgi:hypothetical protein